MKIFKITIILAAVFSISEEIPVSASELEEITVKAAGQFNQPPVREVSSIPLPVIEIPIDSGVVSADLKTLYATKAKDKTGVELLQTLHEVTGSGARINIWAAARKYLFTADRVTVNGASGILTAYSQVFVPGTSDRETDYPEPGDSNGDNFVDSKINVEHTWPASFFDEKEPMKSDLHHLQLTFETPNSRRKNLPYGRVASRPGYVTNSGSQTNAEEFEPCDADKGNTARAMLYFFMRYYDNNITGGSFDKEIFWNIRLETFLKWNRLDPPDDNERKRNNLIEQFQGNRNPFIDDPSLADKIGIEAFKLY